MMAMVVVAATASLAGCRRCWMASTDVRLCDAMCDAPGAVG